MTVKLTLMNSFKRTDFPSREKNKTKQKLLGFIYQNSKDAPERTTQTIKRGGRKEGRKEWGKKME